MEEQTGFIDSNKCKTSYMDAVVYEDACTTIAMEECSELIQAVSKAKRGKLDANNMAEEIADVLICIDWISEIYGIDKTEVEKWRRYKKNRVIYRLLTGNFK